MLSGWKVSLLKVHSLRLLEVDSLLIDDIIEWVKFHVALEFTGRNDSNEA